MKRMSMIIIAAIFCLALSAQAQAQSIKVGYLDLSKTFDNFEKTKEYDSVLEGLTKSYENTRNEKIEKMKEAQGRLALLKDEEKAKLEEEIETMKADLLEYDRAQRTDLTKDRDEKIREILLEIEKVVSDFAKKGNYDYILNDRVLIYGNEQLNVTDDILKILNDNYNKQ